MNKDIAKWEYYVDFILKPDDDWWRSSTGGTLKWAGTELLKNGAPLETVEGTIAAVVSAIREEYGE